MSHLSIVFYSYTFDTIPYCEGKTDVAALTKEVWKPIRVASYSELKFSNHIHRQSFAALIWCLEEKGSNSLSLNDGVLRKPIIPDTEERVTGARILESSLLNTLLIQQLALALFWISFIAGSFCITVICSLSQKDKYEKIVLIEASHCSTAFSHLFSPKRVLKIFSKVLWSDVMWTK